MSIKLHTIIGSTRPGRVGPAVAKWFNDLAAQRGDFDARLVDLAEFKLPIFDEPEHPMKQNYRHDHTKKWAASVAAADAFVFVTPEYNYTMPASLSNALSYLSKEWNYKPAGFVSYGGVSGGLRAAQTARQLVTTMKMMPVPEGVAVPNVFGQLDATGAFKPNDLNVAAAKAMLDEIAKWAGALKPLRQPASLRLAS
ncbi:MAG: NAD(P)H-dependent oxidoreductase [Beijerinckiaceae bacterium]